jgi:hypothetical protein
MLEGRRNLYYCRFTRYPEAFRSAVVNPILEEVDSAVQIFSPRCKGLHGKETFLIPQLRDLIVEEGVSDQLQLLTHYNQTLQGLLYIHKVFFHHFQKSIITNDLLDKHCIH